MKTHCHESAYMFQVKKCSESTCSYCSIHPIRKEMELFSQLSFMPLSLLDLSNEHYKAFTDIYGNPLSDKDQEQIAEDRERKSLLVSGKVRATIICDECQKHRCIYSRSILTDEQQKLIADIKDSRLYSCGASKSFIIRRCNYCQASTSVQLTD